MLFSHILKKSTGRYKLHESKEKINYLMYMDDIKLFAKKWESIGNPNTGSEGIQSRYRDGICNRKVCLDNTEKQ